TPTRRKQRPAPAPAKIRAELISGGNHANSGTIPTPNQPAVTNGTDNQPNPNTHQPMGGS
ncbi:hypothetical protein I547_4414, partial [Mycobacterium kansasii 824]